MNFRLQGAILLALVYCTVAGCQRALPNIALPPRDAGLPHPTATPFTSVVEKLRHAVLTIATFDENEHLVSYGHGFFVSPDGRFLLNRNAIHQASQLTARLDDGRNFEVTGGYTGSGPALALQLDTHDAAFVQSTAVVAPAVNNRICIVLNPIDQTQSAFLEARIASRVTDSEGVWFSPEHILPRTAMGAPAFNERGELIGIISQRNSSSPPEVFSPASGSQALLASVVSETIPALEDEPPPPAESPPPLWPKPQPAASARTSGKLVYSPSPRYPKKLRWSHWNLRSQGLYRLSFNAEGQVSSVETVRSAGHPAFDETAAATLHQWRAEPGHSWTANVPIAFRQ